MQKITESLLLTTLEKASASPRQRMNHNFHPDLDSIYQRMLNSLIPGTYLTPHRHANPPKNETFIVLKGKLVVIEFNDSGTITDHLLLDPETGNYGVDFFPNTWHTVIALTPAVVFEAKDGPYIPLNDKDFAPWAPPEGSDEAMEYQKMLLDNIHKM